MDNVSEEKSKSVGTLSDEEGYPAEPGGAAPFDLKAHSKGNTNHRPSSAGALGVLLTH